MNLHHWSDTSAAPWSGFFRHQGFPHIVLPLHKRSKKAATVFLALKSQESSFLKGAEVIRKENITARSLHKRCSSNASLPYASDTSVHQLNPGFGKARTSLGEKVFFFSMTHFVPALTANISKLLLSEADHKSAAHLYPAHFSATNI